MFPQIAQIFAEVNHFDSASFCEFRGIFFNQFPHSALLLFPFFPFFDRLTKNLSENEIDHYCHSPWIIVADICPG
jgi:hypothetical protein